MPIVHSRSEHYDGHERYPLTMSAGVTIFLVQVTNIYMEDLMRIAMIAGMVIGMVALNGCAYISTELDGKILVDTSNGKRYKLEW